MNLMNVNEMSKMVLDELKSRKLDNFPGSYNNEKRGKTEDLFGVADSVCIYYMLGESLGDYEVRSKWGEKICSFQDKEGMFRLTPASGPGHDLCMTLQAFNLLGYKIPAKVAPLAPLQESLLSDGLLSMNWESTHKELWGMTAPLLSTGLVSKEWQKILYNELSRRIPWCKKRDEPWKIISKIFHILTIFDAGRMAYPKSKKILKILLNLKWEKIRKRSKQTPCTDGDWAWCLINLCSDNPGYYPKAIKAIEKVSKERIDEWNKSKKILDEPIHNIKNYLWGTSIFQNIDREHYFGRPLKDVYNDPSLLRLK